MSEEVYMILGVFLGAGFVIVLEVMDRSLGLIDWLVEKLDAWTERNQGE